MLVQHEDHRITILLVYIDDIILIESDTALGYLTILLDDCFTLKTKGI